MPVIDPKSLDLVVVWRIGGSLYGGPIEIAGDVAKSFHDYVSVCDAGWKSDYASLARYDVDAEYEKDSPANLMANDDIPDQDLLAVLRSAHVQDVVTGEDLNEHKPFLYAVTTCDEDGSYRTYVRASSPVKFPRHSLKGFVTDSFDRMEEPIVVFDGNFDFILCATEVVVLNSPNFERLVNSDAAALHQASRWTKELGRLIPIAESGASALEAYLANNMYGRRKFQSIRSKPHMQSVTTTQLTDALVKHHLDPEDYLKDGKLDITASNVKTILNLLNEDIFAGEFSGAEYAAARKSPM